jgi:hypothetical protein
MESAKMKAYRASAKGGFGVTATTPRDAALAFFANWPTKRKCSIVEGETDGTFFSVTYGNPWPKYWPDVTPKTAANLPSQNCHEIAE